MRNRSSSAASSEVTKATTIEIDARVQRATDMITTLGRCTMHFASIERVPRYTSERRENDAEHSFMLALCATELAANFFPELQVGLVSQFAVVHDLVELMTGDTATYILSEAALSDKAEAEHAALESLAVVLPQHTATLLKRYEQQIESEARFVRLVDKLLPVLVDLLGPGEQVMREDYGISSREQVEANEQRLSSRFRALFPEPQYTLVHMVREFLADRFAQFMPSDTSTLT